MQFFCKDLAGVAFGVIVFHIPTFQNPLAYLCFLVGIVLLAIGISPPQITSDIHGTRAGILVVQLCTRDFLGLVFGVLAFYIPTFQDSVGYLGFLGSLVFFALGGSFLTPRPPETLQTTKT